MKINKINLNPKKTECFLKFVLDSVLPLTPDHLHLVPLLLVHVGANLLQPGLLAPQEAGRVCCVEEIQSQQGPHWRVHPGLGDFTVGQEGDLGHDERVYKAAEEKNNQDGGRDTENTNSACHH